MYVHLWVGENDKKSQTKKINQPIKPQRQTNKPQKTTHTNPKTTTSGVSAKKLGDPFLTT